MILLRTSAASMLLLAVSWSHLNAQINGFTEPLRVVELAGDEAGAIAKLYVTEGSKVEKNEVLARLDDRLQRLQVERAQHLLDSSSALDAARQTFHKRQVIAERIAELVKTGHATESELIRAELELSIAHAKYLAAEEDAVLKEIDLRRAKVTLDRRSIRAPFDGIVSKLHRKQGEFLSPLRPELVTLIQTEELLAVFNVPSIDVATFAIGKERTVTFDNGRRLVGTVYSIGVQTDAESGTVQLKVRLDNADGQSRSGEQCYLEY